MSDTNNTYDPFTRALYGDCRNPDKPVPHGAVEVVGNEYKFVSFNLVPLEQAAAYCRIYEIDGKPVPLPPGYRQRPDGTYERISDENA